MDRPIGFYLLAAAAIIAGVGFAIAFAIGARDTCAEYSNEVIDHLWRTAEWLGVLGSAILATLGAILVQLTRLVDRFPPPPSETPPTDPASPLR